MKVNSGDVCQFIRDTCLFTLRDMGYLVPPIQASLIEKDKLVWKMDLFNDEGHPNGNKLRSYRLYKSDLETELYVKLAIQRDHRRS